MSIWRETNAEMMAGCPEDDYQGFINSVLGKLSKTDRELDQREAKYALELMGEYADMSPSEKDEAIEKRIMERFAAEEAART